MIFLGCMDLDLALRTEQSPTFESNSSAEDKKTYKKWDCSNRLSLMIMKYTILETFRGTLSKETNAKEFLDDLEKRFAKTN